MNYLAPADLTVFEGVTVGAKQGQAVKNLLGVAVLWPVFVATAIGFWACLLFDFAGLRRAVFNFFVLLVAFVAHGAVVMLPYLALFTIRGQQRRCRYVISREYLQLVETVGGFDRVPMQVPLRNVAWVGVGAMVGSAQGLFLDVHDVDDAETFLPGWKERTRPQFGHDYHLTAVQCDWSELVEAVNRALGTRRPENA